jgi:hypothetical protein
MIQEDYEKLSSHIEKEVIDRAYCNGMLRRKACPLGDEHNCNTCLPILQAILTSSHKGNDPRGLAIYLLKHAGNGDLNIWYNDPKKLIKPAIHDSANPFQILAEDL